MTDMDLDTVDMMTNFDGNEIEPVVLPSRLPVCWNSNIGRARAADRSLASKRLSPCVTAAGVL